MSAILKPKYLLIFILTLVPVLAWSQGTVSRTKKHPPKTEKKQTQKNNTSNPNQAGGRANEKIVYDTVTTTRYLTSIAKEHYGNYHFWPYIYLENESIKDHPDRIKPGTRVIVPDLSKYGIDPQKPADITKAKQLGQEIYKRFN